MDGIAGDRKQNDSPVEELSSDSVKGIYTGGDHRLGRCTVNKVAKMGPLLRCWEMGSFS